MPFECPIQFRPISESEFKKLDYEVMRHAFASHNHLGRLCDEAVYRNDMAARLHASGMGPVRCELPLVVSHQFLCWMHFSNHRIDLVTLKK